MKWFCILKMCSCFIGSIFYMTRVPIDQTNRYILSLLNIDDIKYANKTLSSCIINTIKYCMYIHYLRTDNT